MSRYINLICPHCKTSFTDGYSKAGYLHNLSNYGPETLFCSDCGSEVIFSSSFGPRKPYYKMNKIGKIWVNFLMIFHSIMYGGMSGMVLSGALPAGLFNMEPNPILIIFSTILGTIVMAYFNYRDFFEDDLDL